MPLDPRLLTAFVVVADELHVGRAADRLHLSQPALSKQLSRLERQVGAELLDRGTRPLSLTPAGLALLEPAGRAVQAAAEAEIAVRALAREVPRVVRVGLDIDLDDALALLSAFAAPSDHYEVWLSRFHELQGRDAVVTGHIDAFIGYRPVESVPVSGRVADLGVPLLAVVHRDHPLASRTAISLTEFRQSPIAIFARDGAPPASFAHLLSLLAPGGDGAAGPRLELIEVPASSTTSYLPMLAEVATGRAVSFSTAAHVRDDPRLRVLPFDPPLSLPIYVSWHSAPAPDLRDHMTRLRSN